LVHVVHFGDTLQGIMAAYASYGITLERLQELNGWRFPPQFIYVDEQIIILPPGSIDPGSGLSVPVSVAPAVEAAPTADSVTVGGGAAPVEADDPAPVVRLNAEQIAAIPPVETITAFLP
jgi:LysM repeat protein